MQILLQTVDTDPVCRTAYSVKLLNMSAQGHTEMAPLNL